MKVEYSKFLKEYKESGLTQSKFGKLKGMSSSMVSYYVKRGKEISTEVNPRFAKVEFVAPKASKVIITMPSGVVVELPL